MLTTSRQLKNFKNKFVKNLETGCLEWVAAKTSHGYGYFNINGKNKVAHRVAYETFVGPIPEELELNHICKNRRCINLDHLEVVTHKENMITSDSRGEAHHSNKLLKEQVDEIREKYSLNLFTQKELSEAYGVSQGLINQIVNWKIWN